ncbi:MAG: tetratricopeptide repeat protein [Longimicrobiaceae bacterium]
MSQHAFVAMPFGTKQGIDFNAVFRDFIEPALEAAGLEVFRADEELRAGDIPTDMFQELLLADVVVADLSIDNPNVWYELGVRDALRARGVIQVQSQRDYMPFDVYTQRTLRYRVKDGVPDPVHLEEDRAALKATVRATLEDWRGRKVSPVYHLLPNLEEPQWKRLRVGSVNEFWQKQEEWERRVETARLKGRAGDIVTLAEEAPTRVLRQEAHGAAGSALMKLRKYAFALEQYEAALEIDPGDQASARFKGILLGRLGRREEAKTWLRALADEHPDDAETWGLLGRVEKERWTECWHEEGAGPAEMRQAAVQEKALLREAYDAYLTGFRREPGRYYPGINALTLSHLLLHLSGTEKEEQRREREVLAGGVRWAVQCSLARNGKDYWVRATLAEMEVLAGGTDEVEDAYGKAVAVANGDWFAVDSSRQQLLLLRDLEFRPEAVDAGLRVLNHALRRLKRPENTEPRQVFLFSGHMIDKPDRSEPRFPASGVRAAADAIAARLDQLGASADDLGVCGGACGGDLLFARACLDRGLRLELRLPFAEPRFLRESVVFAGEEWRDRFYEVRNDPLTRLYVATDELGPAPRTTDPFARNNLWQLYSALTWGPEKVTFVALWNGKGGDGPGGTQHMVDAVREHSGRVHILDTNTLFG